MNLTEVCIRRPVLAWMLIAATVLFGIVAARLSHSTAHLLKASAEDSLAFMNDST